MRQEDSVEILTNKENQKEKLPKKEETSYFGGWFGYGSSNSTTEEQIENNTDNVQVEKSTEEKVSIGWGKESYVTAEEPEAREETVNLDKEEVTTKEANKPEEVSYFWSMLGYGVTKEKNDAEQNEKVEEKPVKIMLDGKEITEADLADVNFKRSNTVKVKNKELKQDENETEEVGLFWRALGYGATETPAVGDNVVQMEEINQEELPKNEEVTNSKQVAKNDKQKIIPNETEEESELEAKYFHAIFNENEAPEQVSNEDVGVFWRMLGYGAAEKEQPTLTKKVAKQAEENITESVNVENKQEEVQAKYAKVFRDPSIIAKRKNSKIEDDLSNEHFQAIFGETTPEAQPKVKPKGVDLKELPIFWDSLPMKDFKHKNKKRTPKRKNYRKSKIKPKAHPVKEIAIDTNQELTDSDVSLEPLSPKANSVDSEQPDLVISEQNINEPSKVLKPEDLTLSGVLGEAGLKVQSVTDFKEEIEAIKNKETESKKAEKPFFIPDLKKEIITKILEGRSFQRDLDTYNPSLDTLKSWELLDLACGLAMKSGKGKVKESVSVVKSLIRLGFEVNLKHLKLAVNNNLLNVAEYALVPSLVQEQHLEAMRFLVENSFQVKEQLKPTLRMAVHLLRAGPFVDEQSMKQLFVTPPMKIASDVNEVGVSDLWKTVISRNYGSNLIVNEPNSPFYKSHAKLVNKSFHSTLGSPAGTMFAFQSFVRRGSKSLENGVKKLTKVKKRRF